MRKVEQLATLYTKEQETRLDTKEVDEDKTLLEYCLLLWPKPGLPLIQLQ